jgi:hypothetical protein
LGGYRVYIGETSRNYSRVIDIGNQTQFTVNDLEYGATFFFSVTAIDNTGTLESDFSNEVRETIVYADVPLGHWAWEYIQAITDGGITLGCAPNLYCPTALLTRAEMALFLLRAEYGSGYIPPPAIGTVFYDVPLSHWAAAWIEDLAGEGITTGCGGGNYCPDAPVSRAEMALFLLRAKYGSGYIPPSAIGTMFQDVPLSHWAAAWIEDLAGEGITTGCGGGNYCPEGPVNRAQMAVFLQRTFDLPLPLIPQN